MKKGSVLIISLILLATIGVAIFSWLIKQKDDFSSHIALKTDKVTHETLKINDLDLCPGMTKEHIITINTKITGNYLVSFNFIEKSEGSLKNYIDVEIKMDGKIIEYAKLTNLFSKDLTTHTYYIANDETKEIVVRYAMSLKVGNEAQGTHTDFNIILTFKKI